MMNRTVKTFSQFILENEIESISNSTSGDDILKKYLSSKPELIPIYKEIQTKLKDKFTDKHFEDEKAVSGGLKSVSGSLLPQTLSKFKALQKELPGISYSEKSYRSYNLQKETFLKYGYEHGNSISGALTQAGLPGYSQHHTGKALDVSNYKNSKGVSLLTPEILKKHGFYLPYEKKSALRMAEPWHICLTS